MKKIGILTFHYVDNYGAVLQAYALRKILNQFPGYQAEIINYVPEGYGFEVYLEEELMKFFVKRRKRFEAFLTEKCGICSPMTHALKETSYDYYCVGSDQVWNMGLRETENQAYFLRDLGREAVKFSYAASIGTDIHKIDKKVFQKNLADFAFVGIREQSYIEEINKICNIKCVHNIDPTLLLLRKDYETLINEYGKEAELPSVSEPYILYIWNGEGSLQSIELVNTIARKYGLTVLHNFVTDRIITRKMLCRDGGYILDKGIEEFIWYVQHSDFVVTNLYHVGIFALIFQRPVYSYVSEGRQSRQKDLAEMLGIKNRIVDGYKKPEDISMDMDYKAINAAVRQGRESSIEYLKKVLVS